MSDSTVPRMVLQNAARWSERCALMHKADGQYRPTTWQQMAEQIRIYGRALIALGIEPGDRVAIMGPNGPGWAYADLGALACGAVSVPVYHTEGTDAVMHILSDAASRVLFIHSPTPVDALLERRGELSDLEHIVFLEEGLEHADVFALDDFLQRADEVDPARLDERLDKGKSADLASLVYTSGTTGKPKGVMLTHGNILANIEACADLFPIGPDDICLSFLPLSHVFERVDGYYFMLRQGVTIAYAEGIESVPVNLAEVKPTVMVSVPRLYEKMYARVMERVLNGPWVRKQIFFAALKAGKSYAGKILAGQKPGPILEMLVALAKHAVFSKLQERLGGRLRFFVSGGAPLSVDIAEFFLAAGIDIYEGYGLTESAGGITVNSPEARKLGTVGKPFENISVRIADDGEILLKGSGIFEGYWQRPEETEESFSDGWFKTGDTGEIDSDGFLRIVDRKKDIIVTASGENIAPQNLENLLKTDKYIANAFVYGDRKPYLTALIVPNLENLETFAKNHHVDYLDHCDLVNHPKILELLRNQIDQLQGGMTSFKRIKRFTLLSRDFAKDEITPTMKLKRKVITKNFRAALEGMYFAKDHGIHDVGFCIIEGTEND